MTNKDSAKRIADIIQSDNELKEAFEGRKHAREAALLLTAMREEAGLTKAELAARMGVKPPRINEAEDGLGPNGPTYRFMSQAAEACGFSWPKTINDLKAKSNEPTTEPRVMPVSNHKTRLTKKTLVAAMHTAFAKLILELEAARDDDILDLLNRRSWPNRGNIFQRIRRDVVKSRLHPVVGGYNRLRSKSYSLNQGSGEVEVYVDRSSTGVDVTVLNKVSLIHPRSKARRGSKFHGNVRLN